MRIFDWLKRRFQDPKGDLMAGHEVRVQDYLKYLRFYLGYALKDSSLTGIHESDWRRVRYNLCRPIANLAAAWMAARPLDWDVAGDTEATMAAYEIWKRSGGQGALLSAALGGAIYGDQVALATANEAGEPLIEFVDPGVCYPRFHGRDSRKLQFLDVCFEQFDDAGQSILYREMYEPDRLTVYEGDQVVRELAYPELPAAWIRNQEVQGLPYGLSDLDNVAELVEEYDHVAGKGTRIIDYYASPRIVMKGVRKGDIELKTNSVIYLPNKDSEAAFLEWSGPSPGCEDHLTRIRNTIAELSETPAVAFGQADSGLTSISGVALEILYGPLNAKTGRKQQTWGPCLEHVMRLCLLAAGHDVQPGQVRVIWPKAMPIDQQAKLVEESGRVAANLSSLRTAMDNLGVEDSGRELRRILVEKALMNLPSQTGAAVDPVKTAQASAKGSVPADKRAVGAVNVAGEGAETGGSAPEDLAATLADLLESFDTLTQLEDDWEQREDDETESGEA